MKRTGRRARPGAPAVAAFDQESVRMPGDLDGLGAAVTGGGSGIGLATVWLLGIARAARAALRHLRRSPTLAIDGGVQGLRLPAGRR